MTNQDLYLSKKGVEDLKLELAKLLEERKKVVVKIKEAREYGDLSENAEYIEAKNKQSFVEGRIHEIESLLKIAKVIDNNGKKDVISLGSKVTIKVNGNTREFIIAGSDEASPEAGTISNESPLGKTLLGHKKGDTVEIETPDGSKKYKVLEVN
jgi:transcription elongation factor GreA